MGVLLRATAPHGDYGRRNKALLARLAVPPSTARILEEIDIEISDALHFATAADLQSLMRLLRMAKFEVNRLRQRPEYKDKS
jgi:hypothetical protein